ncbi:MAG: hypothetical protein EA341_00520 [Mongoliibacter sp.]|uniref:glycosyltransferase n=1 Tax=Mongoliibacter sp. TaxID=2022438 RepID=UPI0012EF8306|nr:glycosyltransferase [Mongoliibacter sp.]TVP53947.1 MAG: hypothetical protein EA341_00520 [Mongoliibacter sp.]
MIKLLFISWDSATSNYLESLFFPILKGLQEKGEVQAHVIQFSWAGKNEVKRIAELAKNLEISYTHHKVKRKPFAGLGALEAVYRGVFFIKQYIEKNGVEMVMPRSTMPATMVNRLWDWLKKKEVQVVFDADGFPLQERVDFAGMDKNGLYYKLLHGEELKMLQRADRILVRSKAAKIQHSKELGQENAPNIFLVANGRDASHFKLDLENREAIRKTLELREEDLLWVYTGTIGPQYRLDDMLALFQKHWKKHPRSKFVILSISKHVDLKAFSKEFQKAIIFKNVAFTEIPHYLSAADLGLSLRQAAPSISGLAPIKTGEYLMMGLPVIVSPGVGDTDQLLKDKDFAFFWESGKEESLELWLQKVKQLDPSGIRQFAQTHFSLGKSLGDYGKALALEG